MTHSLWGSLTRGHWWDAPTALRRGVGAGRGLAHPTSVLSESVVSFPLPLHADVQLHIPLTHRNNRYCAAVFKETLRLYPPAPLTARHTTKEAKLEDITVPAGTAVWLPIWFIHRSEFNYDRPLAFEPERFLDARATQSAKNFFPFSAGKRNCVGQRFAMLEGTILLALIVRDLKFRMSPGAPEVKAVSAGVVMRAKDGIHMVCSRR